MFCLAAQRLIENNVEDFTETSLADSPQFVIDKPIFGKASLRRAGDCGPGAVFGPANERAKAP